jgi:hypothetical protein
VEFAVGLVIDNDRTGRSHTVVVFDMSGERLQRTDRETAFINQLSGLICVVDPQAVRGLVHPQTGGNNGDRAFDVTLDRLRKARCAPGDHFIPIPSVTVVGKSDLLTRRGYDELRPWLPHGGQEDLDLHTVEAESRDLYAFLYSRGGGRWLGPAQECADSTLHLASATGGPARLLGSGSDAVASFPRESFRQQRVLRPLMSLLALTGVLDRSEITGPEHVGGRP